MTRRITFTLDGVERQADEGDTIWTVARDAGVTIPHLCWRDAPGYRADGNCRACMVEIEGERVLTPSCQRTATEGMVVETGSARATFARKGVFELLACDQPPHDMAPDRDASFWQWADELGAKANKYPADNSIEIPADMSHPAMAVALNACIHCGLCARACREVQHNDIIGLSYRGQGTKVTFDLDDPMGTSACVACGECVAVCPTGALMPATCVDKASGIGSREYDASIPSVCPYCGVGCQITYHLREGEISHVEGRDGPANENRLCVKGRFGFNYISHPHRLTRPLIRIPGAPKNMDVDPANPSTHFREASWDEALEFAASGIKKVKSEHGANALAGFGSAKCSNEEAYLFQKLIRTGFGTNNVDHCTRLCHASSVAALMEGIGSGAVTATFNECENADVIIIIGANPTENHPVAATYFKAAATRGAKLLVMDPRGQALSRHATHMVQFRPGSDVALLNAIMHVIIKEELTDEHYINAHTEGFEALKKHLENYPPEQMSEKCGIDAETIKDVARTFGGAKNAMIFWGMGVSQHSHGTDNARCLIALALITGQVGRPGTGLHPLRGQNNVQGSSDAGLIPMFFPDYAKTGDNDQRDHLEKLWGAPLSPTPGQTVVEIINAAYDGDIQAMYIMGENPAMSDPDVAHARLGLARLEHLVVQDIFLTETAMYADVILPATAWPEKTGTVTNTNRQVQLGRKAVDPPGEAREDWWITRSLATALGLNWSYEHPREIFSEMKAAMPSLDNITWERLEREGAVTYPCHAPDQPGEAVVFADGFPTRSGRALIVPAGLQAPAEEPDDEYPFVLTTGRQLEHWHTGAMTRRSDVLDALEPGPIASLHPDVLARLGVTPGDDISITTRRGEITLTARADRAIQHGMIFIPFAYVEAAANMLTNPVLDPMGKIPEYKFCAARVSPTS